jgi:TRAP-type mannitol/chloroaromatic compound transport system substrate-binding protein
MRAKTGAASNPHPPQPAPKGRTMSTNKTVSMFAATAALLSFASVAEAQNVVRWNCASSYPQNQTTAGRLGPHIVDMLNKSGLFQAKHYDPGALVPAFQTFDAAQSGSIDCSHSSLGFYVNKDVAFAVVTVVPFGPGLGEYLAWFDHGGGNEILDELLAPHKLKGPIHGITMPEASGWFRKEIKTVEDLKGLKMRFLGLGARVMDKLGVSTQLLPPGDIYPALERGVIDAAEYSNPENDEPAGFHQIAKHYYFPGWHQQISTFHWLMPRDKYEALSDQHKTVLRMAMSEGIRSSVSQGEAFQFAALNRIKAKGVNVHYWSPEILKLYREKWNEVVAELSKENPRFKKAIDSLNSFRRDYAEWNRLVSVRE